jgi:hypothetical protein
MTLFRGVDEVALYCAHRTSTASTMLLPHSHHLSQEGDLFGLPLRASNEGLLRPRVARAQEANRPPIPSFSFFPTSPSRGAVRLSFTARIERAQVHRARSASKKDGLAAPLPP